MANDAPLHSSVIKSCLNGRITSVALLVGTNVSEDEILDFCFLGNTEGTVKAFAISEVGHSLSPHFFRRLVKVCTPSSLWLSIANYSCNRLDFRNASKTCANHWRLRFCAFERICTMLLMATTLRKGKTIGHFTRSRKSVLGSRLYSKTKTLMAFTYGYFKEALVS